MFLCEALWVCLVYEKCYINKVTLPNYVDHVSHVFRFPFILFYGCSGFFFFVSACNVIGLKFLPSLFLILRPPSSPRLPQLVTGAYRNIKSRQPTRSWRLLVCTDLLFTFRIDLKEHLQNRWCIHRIHSFHRNAALSFLSGLCASSHSVPMASFYVDCVPAAMIHFLCATPAPWGSDDPPTRTPARY